MKKTWVIRNQQAFAAWQATLKLWKLEKPIQIDVSFYKKRRSNDQNAKMWAMLTDVSDSVMWHGQELTKEDWKNMFTASLKGQQAVPGIDGGFVVLGVKTSEMNTSEISDLIELMNAFGAEHNVVWTDAEDTPLP